MDDALDRLLDLLPGADADGKEKLRVRLLDYFEVVRPPTPASARPTAPRDQPVLAALYRRTRATNDGGGSP